MHPHASSSFRSGRDLATSELGIPSRGIDPQVRARPHFEDKVQLIALKMRSWNKNCYESGFFKFQIKAIAVKASVNRVALKAAR